MSTIASYSPLNISETARDYSLVQMDHEHEIAYGESNGHVTPKGQTRDRNTLRTQYLENSWRCYLAPIANYYTVRHKNCTLPAGRPYNNFVKLCRTMIMFGI